MLALTALSAGWQAVIFALAIALFLVAAIIAYVKAKAVDFIALGLALFVFVFFYNALAAS